jgi:hypothetical protein
MCHKAEAASGFLVLGLIREGPGSGSDFDVVHLAQSMSAHNFVGFRAIERYKQNHPGSLCIAPMAYQSNLATVQHTVHNVNVTLEPSFAANTLLRASASSLSPPSSSHLHLAFSY